MAGPAQGDVAGLGPRSTRWAPEPVRLRPGSGLRITGGDLSRGARGGPKARGWLRFVGPPSSQGSLGMGGGLGELLSNKQLTVCIARPTI